MTLTKASLDPVVWKDRIIGMADMAPDQILANPFNHRIHPTSQQEAVKGSLHEMGFVKPVLINKNTGHLLDGHLRVALAMRENQPTIKVIILDLTEEQEKKMLAVLDATTGMAVIDTAMWNDLTAEVSFEDPALKAMLDDMHRDFSRKGGSDGSMRSEPPASRARREVEIRIPVHPMLLENMSFTDALVKLCNEFGVQYQVKKP